MSDMLQKAIIDAEALKEAATKNAETLVLEKFSSQIKDAVENLLEQDDLGLGLDMPTGEAGQAPAQPAAPAPDPAQASQPAELTGVAKNIPLAAMSASDDEIEIPLDQLFEEVDRMTQSFRFAGGEQIMDEDLMDEGVHPDALEEDYLEEEYFEEDLMDEDYLEEDYLEEELMEEDYFEEGLDEYELEEGFFDDDETEHGQFRSADGTPLPMSGHYVETDPENPIRANLEMYAEPDYYGRDELEEDYLEEDYLEEELHQGGHGWPHGHPAEEGPLGESLHVDMKPVKRGWAGMSEGEITLAEEELLAMEYDSKVREEREAMRKKVKELSESNMAVTNYNKKLVKATNKSAKYITKLRDGVLKLEEKLDQASLLNAKLLYQNKALENDSLNERQKENIVEAVSNADTIEEARVIYETLQNTVGSTSRKTQPNSLSEAVQKSSSVILSSRRESERSQKQDPTLTRWKFLAGIDKQ